MTLDYAQSVRMSFRTTFTDRLLLITFFIVLSALVYAISWTAPAWSDPGNFQRNAIEGFSAIKQLTAITHPGWVIVGDWVFRATHSLAALVLISVLPTTLAATTLLWYGLRQGLRRADALLLATAFLLTHVVLWNATVTKEYPLQLGLLAVEFSLLLRYWRTRQGSYFVVASLLSGFALSVCQLEVFTIGAVAATMLLVPRTRPRVQVLAAGVIAFLVGLLPALVFIIGAAHTPMDIISGMRAFLHGEWADEIFRPVFSRQGLITRGLVLFSFLGFIQLVGVRRIFSKKILQRPESCFLAVLAVSSGIFAVTYNVETAFYFASPAIFALFGLAVSGGALRFSPVTVIASFMQPLAIALVVGLFHFGVVSAPQRDKTVPYRNEMDYWLNPVRIWQQRGPEQLLMDVTNNVANDGRTGLLVHWVVAEPLSVALLLDKANGFEVIHSEKRFVSEDEPEEACRANPRLANLLMLDPVEPLKTKLERRSYFYSYSCEGRKP